MNKDTKLYSPQKIVQLGHFLNQNGCMTTHNMECVFPVLQNKILNLSVLHAKQNIFIREKEERTKNLIEYQQSQRGIVHNVKSENETG